MASFLRPRRGKKATADNASLVLKRGEVFFEVPTTGVGTGSGKIKMGDGSTEYKNLPYFGSTEDDKVGFTNTSAKTDYSNNATYLSNVAPTNSLKTIFTNLKQLVYNHNTQLTELNNDLGGTEFRYNNGNTEWRNVKAGADTWVPFKQGGTVNIGGWKLINYGYPMNKGTGSVDTISHTVTEKGTYVLFACQAGRGGYFPAYVPIVSYSGNVENILYQYTKDKWQSCMVVNANIGDTLSVTIYGQPYPLLFSYIAKVPDIQYISLYSDDYNQNDGDTIIKNITEEGRYLVFANVGGSSMDNPEKTNLVQTDMTATIEMDICSLLYNPTDSGSNPYRNFMKSYLVDIKNGEYFKITSKNSGYSRKITVILKCL